jgi:purine-binding chemotaxis protein CheW
MVSQAQSFQNLTAAEGQFQYLTFSLGDEVYGIGILQVKEIIEYGNLTIVPMVPNTIRGVLNLRGNVVPVVDLAIRLGGSSPALVTKHTCIVIIELGSNSKEKVSMGIVVDAVNDVVMLPPTDLEPSPAFGSHIRADFIRNIGKVENQFIILLDLERVLSVEELAGLT